jgi:hypothetical protein
MEYTGQQRAIIARMGEISVRFHATVATQREAQATAGQTMIDAVTALAAAIDRSTELWPLFVAHGDAFREFLDTLA